MNLEDMPQASVKQANNEAFVKMPQNPREIPENGFTSQQEAFKISILCRLKTASKNNSGPSAFYIF